jgi:S-adenosylmethionine uptake transporter
LLTLMDALIAAHHALSNAADRPAALSLRPVGALVYTAWARPGWPKREATVHNGLRAILIVVIATSFFFALGKLPLADAIALSFISPVLTALMGALLLGERVDWRIGVALFAGLGGMLLIVGGSLGTGHYGDDVLMGAGAVLISAIGYSLSIVMLRHRAFAIAGPHRALSEPRACADPGRAGLIRMCDARLAYSRPRRHRRHRSHHARARSPPGGGAAPVQYLTLVWGVVFGFCFSRRSRASPFLGASLIVLGTVRSGADRAGTRISHWTKTRPQRSIADQAPPATQPKLIQP